MFLGIIFYNFSKARKEEESSSNYLSDKQRNWIKLLDLILEAEPELKTVNKTELNVKRVLHRIVEKGYFSSVVYIITALNLILIAGQKMLPKESPVIQEYLNLVSLFLNLTELLLKIVIYSPRVYIKDPWNIFDLVIIVMTSLELIPLLIAFDNSYDKFFGLCSTARVFRFLRLMARQMGVRKLLRTILYSLPRMFDIFILLLIVLFIYAMLGHKCFSNIPIGGGISELANFHNFFNSIMTLLKIATADGWIDIMDTVMESNGKILR